MAFKHKRRLQKRSYLPTLFFINLQLQLQLYFTIIFLQLQLQLQFTIIFEED